MTGSSATGSATGPVRVRVPASSANLGPGYDALGLALGHHDLLTAEVVDGPAPVILVEGEGANEVPLDSGHLVHRAMSRGFAELGLAVPPVRLHCVNAIPHGRGMGSSSAAIVGGLAVARALAGPAGEALTDDRLFEIGAELEGHPDNVAAAVHGGLTIGWTEGGRARAVRLDVTAAVTPVLLVPPDPLATTVARRLLPPMVPHEDAAFSAGRAALLVAALASGAHALLEATEDRLHQRYRAPAMPRSAALVQELRDLRIPAVISGAGPTVLALPEPARVAEVTARTPSGWRALDPGVDPGGVAHLT
ncbi:homoserine kinase [Nocardioides caldifontis]|uniref:homoserine kinase n=1 Tax=Nocardioides caldifontis TaxID=2588938 RepID=UPI0011DFE63F|nr:homoserine kinase [Nocardioides caldifontis]